jgi:hypothetical protein
LLAISQQESLIVYTDGFLVYGPLEMGSGLMHESVGTLTVSVMTETVM